MKVRKTLMKLDENWWKFLLVTLHLLDHTPYGRRSWKILLFHFFSHARHSDTNRMFLFKTFELYNFRTLDWNFTVRNAKCTVNKLSLQNFSVEDGSRHRTRRTILCILFEIEVWMSKIFKKRMLISIKRLFSFLLFHE